MPEVRLIDRQALLSDIDKEIEFFSSSAGNHDYFDRAKKNGLIIARHIIERQPTIEAEPVRHGRWIIKEHKDSTTVGKHLIWECSECGYGCLTATKSFCASCGAKMDLRSQTEVQLDEADSVIMGGAENE